MSRLKKPLNRMPPQPHLMTKVPFPDMVIKLPPDDDTPLTDIR
jgi:hypothetical protein